MVSIFRPRTKHLDNAPVVVIGLGRFGSSLALELMDHGVEVLGVDNSEKRVRDHADLLTECVLADGTDPAALRQLGLEEVEHVVVAIGTHLEASILTASNAVEIGVPDIWAKADSAAHVRILTQLGVHHVIRPERDTGRRVAHLLGGHFVDFAELDTNYGVTTCTTPSGIVGKPVQLGQLYARYRVQLVSRRGDAGRWEPLADGAILTPHDLIVAAGAPHDLEAFTAG